MIVYLMRHGEAALPDPGQPSSLTPKGRADVERIARHLYGRKVQVDLLWHSPKLRAVQTAEILINTLAIPKKLVEEKKELSPDGDFEQIFHALSCRKASHFIIVGHLPTLGDLASLILKGVNHSSSLIFGPAGMSAFELNGRWKWLWDLAPGSLK